MYLVARTVATALAALAVATVLSFGSAVWLQTSTDEADLLWRAAPAGTLGLWTLTAAHGVPLRVEASAGLGSRWIDRIADAVGRRPEVTTTGSVLVASFTVFGAAAAVLVAGARWIAPRGRRNVLLVATVAPVVYACGLAVLATMGTAGVGVQRGVFRAGVEAGPPVGQAFGAGLFWAAVFVTGGIAASGGLSLPRIWRVVGGAWWRALAAGSAMAAAVLVVWLAIRSGDGDLPRPSLVALGVVMLLPNAVATALVAAHGAPVIITLTVGPLAGWQRLDYAEVAGDGGWLFLLVPLVAAVVAGRAMSRRLGARSGAYAFAFAVTWGLTLSVLAILLRVRVLASFSLVRAFAPGGEVAIDPFAALLAGIVWAWAGAYLGMLSVRRPGPPP